MFLAVFTISIWVSKDIGEMQKLIFVAYAHT